MVTMLNTLGNTLEAANNASRLEMVLSKPNNLAATLYKKGSCLEKLGARCLAILQVIVSLVAVPFALLAMIFVPAVTLFTHDKRIARLYVQMFGGMAAAHLFRIPECLIGAIFPSTLIKSIQKEELLQQLLQQGVNMQQMGRIMLGFGEFLQAQ